MHDRWIAELLKFDVETENPYENSGLGASQVGTIKRDVYNFTFGLTLRVFEHVLYMYTIGECNRDYKPTVGLRSHFVVKNLPTYADLRNLPLRHTVDVYAQSVYIYYIYCHVRLFT